jgi:hypothetical protein
LPDLISALLPLIAPAIVVGGVVWRGGAVLWSRFEKKIDQGRVHADERSDALLKKFEESKAETTATFTAVDKRLDAFGAEQQRHALDLQYLRGVTDERHAMARGGSSVASLIAPAEESTDATR